MKTKQVTGQEALDILNNGGGLYCQDYIYFKSVGSIYYKSKDGSLLMKSILNNDDIKHIYWEVEENEPEYNLTIQQVMQKDNIGKYYKMENEEEMTLWLSEDNDGYLELLVVEDDYIPDEYLYSEIQDDIYYLELIVNNKYKEVQYKC